MTAASVDPASDDDVGSANRRATVSSGRGDPSGKRALFESRPDAPDDLIAPRVARRGAQALYSTGPPRTGTVLVTCSDCMARTRISLADISWRLMKLSVWIPGRIHNRRMDCPACDKRTWCKVGWLD